MLFVIYLSSIQRSNTTTTRARVMGLRGILTCVEVHAMVVYRMPKRYHHHTGWFQKIFEKW